MSDDKTNYILGLCETVKNMVTARWTDQEILDVFEESDHEAIRAYLKTVRTPKEIDPYYRSSFDY